MLMILRNADVDDSDADTDDELLSEWSDKQISMWADESFLDALASLEWDMPLTGSTIFREISVNKIFGLTDYHKLQLYNITALQPYNLTIVQPYSLTTLQPYNLTT